MKNYGKSEKGIPGTDCQRGVLLWKEDGADAPDPGALVPGTGIQYRGSDPAKAVSVKIPAEAEEKYFSGMKAKERTDLVMKALDAWFAGKEAADVQ